MGRRNVTITLAAGLVLALAAPTYAHELDHDPPAFTETTPPEPTFRDLAKPWDDRLI